MKNRVFAFPIAVVASVSLACGMAAPKSYPDGADGLKSLMSDIASANDSQAAKLAEGLLLSNADAWFTQHFGDVVGKLLSGEYAVMAKGGTKGLAAAVKSMKPKGQTEFLAEGFSKADDANAVGYQQEALKIATQPVTLYSFRALKPGKKMGWHLYNFVYVGGAWKFAGPLTGLKPDLRKDARLDAVSGLRATEREEFFRSGKLPD